MSRPPRPPYLRKNHHVRIVIDVRLNEETQKVDVKTESFWALSDGSEREVAHGILCAIEKYLKEYNK